MIVVDFKILTMQNGIVGIFYCVKDIISIDKESANEQRARRIGSKLSTLLDIQLIKPYTSSVKIFVFFIFLFDEKTNIDICFS